MTLANVPSLDELTKNPERIKDLSPAVALDMLVAMAAVQPLLLARAVSPMGNGRGEAITEDRLLTVKEVAELLSVPRAFAYELARRGEIPTVRVGRRYIRVPLRALMKVLDGGVSKMYKSSQRTLPHAYDRGRTPDHPQKARSDPGGHG